jgi:photosystem II stability/assembly factor-like uncharacterized protein
LRADLECARIASWSAVSLVLFAAPPALANGRYPASNQLLFSPRDPDLVLLRTTFGILLSHDAGNSWAWLCEDALGISASLSVDPALAITANGTLVAGIYSGLQISPDTGCSWTSIGGGLTGQVVDLALRGASPHTVVALTSTYASDAGVDGSAGYVTQVYESTDDGASWSPLGAPLDPSVSAQTLEVAASDPQRLYVVGFRTDAPLTPLFYASDDSGLHWAEHVMPPLSGDLGVYIAAVDPANADLVYLRTEGAPTNGQSRLFVTTDAGRTFRAELALRGQMLGFALSPDGSTIYAGGTLDGLFVAARDALASPNPFHNVSLVPVRCLAMQGADLWACSDEASGGFLAGVSKDDGVTFAPRLQLHGIQGPISCAADTRAAQCSGTAFQQLCLSIGGCVSVDGGAEPGGGRTAAGASSSCGCSVAGRAGVIGLLGAAASIAAIAARRRRAW